MELTGKVAQVGVRGVWQACSPGPTACSTSVTTLPAHVGWWKTADCPATEDAQRVLALSVDFLLFSVSVSPSSAQAASSLSIHMASASQPQPPAAGPRALSLASSSLRCALPWGKLGSLSTVSCSNHLGSLDLSAVGVTWVCSSSPQTSLRLTANPYHIIPFIKSPQERTPHLQEPLD